MESVPRLSNWNCWRCSLSPSLLILQVRPCSGWLSSCGIHYTPGFLATMPLTLGAFYKCSPAIRFRYLASIFAFALFAVTTLQLRLTHNAEWIVHRAPQWQRGHHSATPELNSTLGVSNPYICLRGWMWPDNTDTLPATISSSLNASSQSHPAHRRPRGGSTVFSPPEPLRGCQ